MHFQKYFNSRLQLRKVLEAGENLTFFQTHILIIIFGFYSFFSILCKKHIFNKN